MSICALDKDNKGMYILKKETNLFHYHYRFNFSTGLCVHWNLLFFCFSDFLNLEKFQDVLFVISPSNSTRSVFYSSIQLCEINYCFRIFDMLMLCS